MPLVRFKIRNELSLGGPEINRSAAVEYEEPKAILGAVEVAGLVGILRQLGDLAEFSAEVFSGIQEEVTVTASRCQKLTSRVKRIESALSPLEKAVLSQTSHIHFAYTAGCEWHPRIRNGQRHFVQSDLPLCVMETYEQCRDPPPLHLLDRFDDGGPGSCLRKYSDPTFFRKELSKHSKADDIKVQRDQAHRKRKKKRLPQRNICRSHAVSTSDETNGARLSSLTDERPTTSQSTSTVDMARSSNMQDVSDTIDAQVQSEAQVQSKPRDSITGSGYIEYVINQSPVKKPGVNLVEGSLSGSLQPANRIVSSVPEDCIEVVDENVLYSPSEDIPVPRATIVCDEKKETLELRVEESNKDEAASEIHESKFGPGTPDRVRQNQRDFGRTYDFFDEVDVVGETQSKSQANSIDGEPGIENEGEDESEQGSEADEFVDARNTIESESESEHDGTPKPKLEHYFGDISTYCSEDANSENNDGSEDIPYEKMAEDPRHDNSLDETCSGSYLPEDAIFSCWLSDPVYGQTLSHDDETFQKPREFFTMSEEAVPDVTVLREEPVAAHTLVVGNCANENISSDECISSEPSLKDAIPAEKILPEEHSANYPSLAEAVPHEKILPGESVAKCPSFAEIFPQEKILPEISVVKAMPDSMTSADTDHPSFPKAVQEKTVSQEVLDSKNLPVPEAFSQEQISLDERFLTEEPATTCLPLTKAMPIEKLLPESYHCLAESPREKILQEKSVDSIHPSCAKDAPEINLSPEVLDSTNLFVEETASQEQIGLEEFVGIDPCITEAVPYERVLPEEQPVTTCLSLTKAVAAEKALPEELLEIYPSFAELPEEKISHEETDNATHPCEGSDVKISPEGYDYTNLSPEEALPHEQNPLEEFVGISPCLAEAIPDERFLPEEPVTTCLSLTSAATIEEVLSEKPMETYPSFAELPVEKILYEEADDATHLSLSEAVSDEQLLPEVSTNLPAAAAIPQEKTTLEEFVGIDPCLAEAVPDMRVLPEENILHVEADDATHPSLSQAVSDEQISPESTDLPVAAAVPQEKITLEEFVNTDPCLAEAVPDKKVLPEAPVTTCMSFTKAAVSIEEVLPEKPLEDYSSLEKPSSDKISQEKSDDATHPSCAKDESDEDVSPEVLDSINLSVAEAIPQEEPALEEYVGVDPCLAEAVPYERVLPEEPVTTCLSLTKALSDEPLEVNNSVLELPEEKISQEEESDDATNPYFSEAVGDETISSLEGPCSTHPSLEESVPQEETSHEEPVGTNPFMESAFSNEISFLDEPGVTFLPEEPLLTYPSLAEAVPDEKISLEELDGTCPPSVEAVSDEKISGSEAPAYTTEDDSPHNKTFSEEPVVTDMSLTETILIENFPGLETPGSITETGPHDKTFPEEPVATYLSLVEPVPDDNIPPKETAAAYLDFAEGIPDQKVFLDDAAFLSFAEAIFDQKFSPEVPDSTYPSLTQPEMTTAPPSLVKEADSADRAIPPSGGTVTISPDTQESLSNGTMVESVSIWSNGGLLGLAPSKPPVFAEPSSVSEHLQNEINEASVLATRKQEATEKSSLPLVVSDPTSQQQSSMLSHSNGSLSDLHSTATSFKVFGLSHRLLMAGFRGNTSSTCKFESIPTTSYGTKVAAIEDKKTQQQTPRGSSFEEQLDYESSLLGSPTSSPPVQHMKISFNTINPSPVSKLKLRIPCQPQHTGENADMFPSFQLVPEASNSDDDDNSDIFCQSSPCVSDNCLSDSELWESDESPRRSASSSKEVGERISHGDMGSFSGSFLDLPCFDSVDHQSTSSRPKQDQKQEQEQEQVVEYIPSVSEIIRDWPPNQSKSSSSNEANANAVLKNTQNQSVGP
ncbi:unnamed protein product [Thlaspi arvense]|uniref:Uncharacterized protein n=1 Tax=Thlaspi arvense TaxID=13288 RepID=A0AAU9T844_THLAR|nr:unnamed protein product [Thlaspi arvense]